MVDAINMRVMSWYILPAAACVRLCWHLGTKSLGRTRTIVTAINPPIYMQSYTRESVLRRKGSSMDPY